MFTYATRTTTTTSDDDDEDDDEKSFSLLFAKIRFF